MPHEIFWVLKDKMFYLRVPPYLPRGIFLMLHQRKD